MAIFKKLHMYYMKGGGKYVRRIDTFADLNDIEVQGRGGQQR
jgi:hypothetical protein